MVSSASTVSYTHLKQGIADYPDYLKYFEGDGDQAFLDCLRYANYTRFESFEDMIADKRIIETKCPCLLYTSRCV